MSVKDPFRNSQRSLRLSRMYFLLLYWNKNSINSLPHTVLSGSMHLFTPHLCYLIYCSTQWKSEQPKDPCPLWTELLVPALHWGCAAGSQAQPNAPGFLERLLRTGPACLNATGTLEGKVKLDPAAKHQKHSPGDLEAPLWRSVTVTL